MALYAAAPLQSTRAGAQGRLLLSAKQPRDVHCVSISVPICKSASFCDDSDVCSSLGKCIFGDCENHKAYQDAHALAQLARLL
jgi:hypothetical protein